MSVSPSDGEHRLLDFTMLARRMRGAAGVLAALAVIGIVANGLTAEAGLTFAIMARWAALFLVGLVLVAAVLVALHAYRGADTAQRRGERLSSDDVGLSPRPRKK